MAAPYHLRFRAIALTLRAGLRGLRPPSAPLRRLRDILLVAQPPLLRKEGSARKHTQIHSTKASVAGAPALCFLCSVPLFTICVSVWDGPHRRSMAHWMEFCL